MKSNKNTTIAGLVIGVLLAAWGVLQPAITGGNVDWKVIIPAIVIAVVMYIQKDSGSWQTTLVGAIFAALIAGASAYQTDPTSWMMVVGAIFSSVGSSLMKDHNKTDTPAITTTK